MSILVKAGLLTSIVLLVAACGESESDPAGPDKSSLSETVSSLWACSKLISDGMRPIPDDRADRFLGKVEDDTAKCRGGDRGISYKQMNTPWVDWTGYWATRDANSRNINYDDTNWIGALFDKGHISPNMRGIDGALIDLEYERVELIKFNLFDNVTYPTYVMGDGKAPSGSTVTVWPEMKLPREHPDYTQVGGAASQLCTGDLIRKRTLDGTCNDITNPLMGSSKMPFARNVQFEETFFPGHYANELTMNRHGDRIGMMKPDPQLISRKLFTRHRKNGETGPDFCNKGYGLDGDSVNANCDYQEAPFFNVLAAFWIQFMTHDWFSHLNEGMNQRTMIRAGCNSDEAEAAGCRPADQYPEALVRDASLPETFVHDEKRYLSRAPKTFDNTVTAWWDASQIYGYDDRSGTRVQRDGAKLAVAENGYLKRFRSPCLAEEKIDCEQELPPQWAGQEWSAFPDNWTIGMSFYHNVFVREHNAFVDAFEKEKARNPGDKSGLRRFEDNNWTETTYADVTDNELFEAARLVVSAEIAKIHTIEWTTQLLYNDPLFRGMNSNWSGLLDGKLDRVEEAAARIVERLKESGVQEKANSWYSVLAAGPGIFGTGSRKTREGEDTWSIDNPEHVNGGINHFGSPFNFPEEFTTVYRLHPLIPDLLELRRLSAPNKIVKKIAAVKAFRAPASDIMEREGIGSWALSMGRQRLGLLHLNNHGRFLQNLELDHLKTDTNSGMLDIAALDIIRDRERGIPRFNEFRRQYGLKQLSSFDDFVDKSLDADAPERIRQEAVAKTMREVYGQHTCDVRKIISKAQRIDGEYPNDCLGHEDGSTVDNVEDVDTVVGWLAEPVRPWGYAMQWRSQGRSGAGHRAGRPSKQLPQCLGAKDQTRT